MKDKIKALFSSGKGADIYNASLAFIEEYSMRERIFKGTLVGLSGGADSVMLLLFLIEYRRREGDFPLVAFHLNHMIRDEEADRDEEYSRVLCNSLSIDFISKRVDIPTLAKELRIGTEECARNVRYKEFSEIIESRNDVFTIAVAHNADDNMETVLLNILRGAGTRGASGIPPVRDNIVRPLLKIAKSDIVESLSSSGIPFVTDSTNLSSDYKRNYIRNEVVAKIRSAFERPEVSFSRLSANLRSDDECLECIADKFLAEHTEVNNTDLLGLHPSIRSRVIKKMAGITVSTDTAMKISKLLSKNNFAYSIGEGLRFVCELGACKVEPESDKSVNFRFRVKSGVTDIPEYSSAFFLSDYPPDNSFLNVYKFSIQANLSSAIIVGDLFLRPKMAGDEIFYGGMTRKLKKLFNDNKIPPSVRNLIPMLCDDRGIVWAPGFGVRDDGVKIGEGKPLYAVIGVNMPDNNARRMHLPCEFKK